MARIPLVLALVLFVSAPVARAMIAADAIRDVIRGSRDALARCVASEPPGTWTVTVRFRIEPDGTVSRAEPTASDFAEDAPALDCVLRTVLALRFAPHARGGHVEVSYPFRFVR